MNQVEIVYARFDPSSELQPFPPSPAPPFWVVLDVQGDRWDEPFINRVRGLPSQLWGAKGLIIRGASKFMEAEQSEDLCLPVAWEEKPVFLLDPLRKDHWVRLQGEIQPEFLVDLLPRVRDVELRSLLRWGNATIFPAKYHFRLPVGVHSQVFVRFADALNDQTSLQRITDWISVPEVGGVAFLCDTVGLLPLVQEIELRAVRRNFGFESIRRFLTSYSTPDVALRRIALECTNWVRSGMGQTRQIKVLVSVSATGRLVDRLIAVFRDLGVEIVPEILCEAGPNPRGMGLCQIPVEHFPSGDECTYCRGGSKPVSIDESRYSPTPFSGITELALPSEELIGDYKDVLKDMNTTGSFRVHVASGDEHQHMPILIDTVAALKSSVLLKRAEEQLRALLPDGFPDLCIVPWHRFTDSIRSALRGFGFGDIMAVEKWAPDVSALGKRLEGLERVLLVDDSVSTTNTQRLLRRAVNQAAPHIEDIRSFVFVSRTPDPEVWEELKRLYSFGGRTNLRAGLILHLPPPNSRCSWCEEQEALQQVRPRLDKAGKALVDRRLERLRNKEGLREHLTLGSELEDEEARKPTEKAEEAGLALVDEVGAFVAATAYLQLRRAEWYSGPESLLGSYRFPTGRLIQEVSRPEMVVGILRGLRPGEGWCLDHLGDLIRGLTVIMQSNPSLPLVSELLWASAQGILHKPSVQKAIRKHVGPIPPPLDSILWAL